MANTTGSVGEQGSQQRGPEDVLGAFHELLQPHEIQVLGLMGLLIGYICVFFAKILMLTNVYFWRVWDWLYYVFTFSAQQKL